jgi:H+/Cl- antiporter ClcA
MPFQWDVRAHAAQKDFFLRWLAISIPVGTVVGSAVALFPWSLERVTALRWQTTTANGMHWLLYLLPVAGVLITATCMLIAKSVESGNKLIVDQFHETGGCVPARMAPLVLIGTLITHLFGGSAGRDGSAVQIGGSLASTICRLFRLREHDVRIMRPPGSGASNA